MGLINLQTDLKSLRFGNDRIHGGNSGQPYITSPIPDGDTSLLPNQDFILRGGLYSAKNTTEDIIRLTKYFNDVRNPSGLLFTVKQNLLSRTAVRTQSSTGLLNEGIYTPLSTLAQTSVSAFGLHFNKQGLNPIPGTPGSLKTYSDSVKTNESNKNNRLINLFGAKILSRPNQSPDFIFLKDDISLNPQFLLSYKGGPGSILGIGNTNIKLSNPTVKNYLGTSLNDPTINYLTYSIKSINTATVKTTQSEQAISQQLSNGTIQLPEIEITNSEYELDNYRNVKNYIPALHQIDFRSTLVKAIRDNTNGITTLMSSAPSYNPVNNKTLEQRVNLGDPGNANGKNLISYTSGSFKGAASETSFDRINAIPIYESGGPSSKLNPDDNSIVNDLIKFRIGVINNNDPSIKTYIHFRAFLNNISDQYSSEWNSTQYIGRGEKFYNYSGFDRKVSLSWTVAAQSKVELIPMYKKLNYLASVCAPDYSEFGYMRGNIITLTIGGYFYEQPGIITGFNYDMNDDNSTWEIGINDEGNSDNTVKELPHLIKVTGFNFIPIHTFVPRLQQNDLSGGINSDNILRDNNVYGNERFIALSKGFGINDNNYVK